MSPQSFTLILHLILAVVYVPLLVTLIQKHAGHETAAMLLSGYILISSLLDVAEGLWQGGQLYLVSPQIAIDFQAYGALILAFLLTLTVISFTRRDSRLWLGIGGFWVLGFILIVFNVFRFGPVIWTVPVNLPERPLGLSPSTAIPVELLRPATPYPLCRFSP